MKREINFIIMILGILILAGHADAVSLYNVTSDSIGSGGTSTGGNYSLTDCIGQPGAAPTASTGGSYSVLDGFLAQPFSPDSVTVDPSITANGYDTFNTIQEGVDAVDLEGVVNVYPGSYSENLAVSKNLTLNGMRAVLSGDSTGTGIAVNGANVTVAYFRVTGFDYGLDVDSTGEATVLYSNFHDNDVYAVRNQNSGETVLTLGNWWGAGDGPDDEAGAINGSGDAISTGVNGSSFSTYYVLADMDGDCLYNGEEDANGNGLVDSGESDPVDKDSDSDGVEDGVEVALSTDPTNGSSTPASPPGTGDTDGDGFKDFYEVAAGTSPDNSSDFPDLGDVNASGSANNTDAMLLFNVALSNIPVSALIMDLGDINRNGMVNNSDAMILFNYSLTNITELPF